MDRDERLEAMRSQLFPIVGLTLTPICLAILSVALGLIPPGLATTIYIVAATFTFFVSIFVLGLSLYVRAVLDPKERQRFLNVLWGSIFFALLFRMFGIGLLLLMPAVFNLQTVIVMKSLKRS